MPADLAELLHDAAPEPAAPVDAERVWRAGRRLRYRKLAGTVTVLAATVLWAVSVGAGERHEEDDYVTTAEAPVFDDPAQGFSVEYPASWQRAATNLTPGLTDPLEILSLGTGDLVAGSRTCAQLPTNALEAMSPTDAFITVQEELTTPAALFPDRPDPLPPPESAGDSEVAACLTGPATFDSWWIRFRDAGRGFYVLVAIGRQATEETRADTWAILHSLRFEPVAASASSRAVISGTLLDGRPWTVRHDAVHGLCVSLGDEQLGCDDVGPVISPGDDPATPRVALAASAPAYGAGSLVYGFLPAGATQVELVHDDGRVTARAVIEPDGRFWAIPVDPEDNPETVVYRDGGGVEVQRFRIGDA